MRDADPDCNFRSDPETFFLLKVWGPLVVGLLVAAFHAPPQMLVVLSPLILWALFGLSLAQVKVDSQAVRYRRLLKWKRIPYQDIVEAGTSSMPYVSFIKLQRPVFPWRKLYFASGESSFLKAGRATKLTSYINARCAGEAEEPTSLDVPQEVRVPEWRIYTCVAACALGMVFTFLMTILFPRPRATNLDLTRLKGVPYWFAFINRLLSVPLTWPWSLITCGVLIWAVVRLRFGTRALMYAFFAGAMLGSFVLRMLV